jgi:uncharacterized protein YceK
MRPVDLEEFDRLVGLIERLRRLRRIRAVLVALAAAQVISGCATCREHPAVCTVVGAVIVGSVAVAVAQHGSGTSRMAPGQASIGAPPCPGPTCT